jgi:hypothetical protein
MKKILIVFCCTFITVFAFATKSPNAMPKKAAIKSPIESRSSIVKRSLSEDECSTTITMSATIYFITVSASCTASAATCDAAISQAANCASAALNKMKQLIYK